MPKISPGSFSCRVDLCFSSTRGMHEATVLSFTIAVPCSWGKPTATESTRVGFLPSWSHASGSTASPNPPASTGDGSHNGISFNCDVTSPSFVSARQARFPGSAVDAGEKSTPGPETQESSAEREDCAVVFSWRTDCARLIRTYGLCSSYKGVRIVLIISRTYGLCSSYKDVRTVIGL